MKSSHLVHIQRFLSAAALLVGLMTLLGGGRVLLLGVVPGYVVFKPLLIFNFSMGFAYILVSVLLWRSLAKGRKGAAAIFLLNLVMLITLFILYNHDYAIATQSLKVMSFRTGFWLIIFAVAFFLVRNGQSRQPPLH